MRIRKDKQLVIHGLNAATLVWLMVIGSLFRLFLWCSFMKNLTIAQKMDQEFGRVF